LKTALGHNEDDDIKDENKNKSLIRLKSRSSVGGSPLFNKNKKNEIKSNDST
jgi:hypothetical protein